MAADRRLPDRGMVACPGFPHPSGRTGRQIETAWTRPGNIRYDIIVKDQTCGRLIGPGGSRYKEMVRTTGCNIFICDWKSPPRHPADVRLVALVGSAHQVELARAAVNRQKTDVEGERAMQRSDQPEVAAFICICSSAIIDEARARLVVGIRGATAARKACEAVRPGAAILLYNYERNTLERGFTAVGLDPSGGRMPQIKLNRAAPQSYSNSSLPITNFDSCLTYSSERGRDGLFVKHFGLELSSRQWSQ
eukprot:4853326-Prymnesium_polylepis.1